MAIALIVLIVSLLTLSALVSRHGTSVYDRDLPEHWGPEAFWNRAPRT
jgi:hypothetical protein